MNQEHKERFARLLQRDHTNLADKERRALFFIISGNEDLFSKVNHLYDFEEHVIKPETLEESRVDFSSGTRRLVMLGFNLFNSSNPADVSNCLSVLDEDNIKLAIEAIRIRFM